MDERISLSEVWVDPTQHQNPRSTERYARKPTCMAAGACPCDACDNRALCRDRAWSCTAFENWVTQSGIPEQHLDRTPRSMAQNRHLLRTLRKDSGIRISWWHY